MTEENIKYPRETDERRLRSRARPDYNERRSGPRFKGSFPVTIYVGEKGKEKVYNAVARNISTGGLALDNLDIPETEKRIRVDFRIPDGTMHEEYLHGRYNLEGEIVSYNRENGRAGVVFTKGLDKYLAGRLWLLLRWSAVLISFIAVSLILLIKVENIYFFWFDVPVFLYSLTVGTYLISRFLFALFYRSPKRNAYADGLPTVALVIPAFNEGEAIEDTIVHALEAAYPADKIQVVAVNDGSTDNTLEVMKRVRERYPELVIVDLGKNQGKRHALAMGARMTRSDIVVFIDSDSFLDREAIRNIVDGFADPKVGAVCGHCEVANPWTNLLTRMQAVRYFIGFRVLKAAESIFDSVTCLSGPLAAYRRDILTEMLDKWTGQTFFGAPATFGDDRSLTNFILPHHKIIYDYRAQTRTLVPEKYRQFFRQQMRWKRSWFRESVRASAFIWRKQPLMSASFYLGFILPMLGPAIVFRALIYVPMFQDGSPLTYLFGILLMSMLMSTSYLFSKRSRMWLYGIPFCFFYMFILVWQLPWAILTFREIKWGTRA